MTKTLFLDFDGVTHPTSAGAEAHFCCAHHIVTVLDAAPDLEVVISSSWRFSHDLQELKARLPAALARRVIGTTGPAHIGRFARHQEILSYVSTRPRLRHWLAVDDSAWEFPPSAPLVRCNPNTGLTEREAQQIVRWARS